MKNYSWLQKSLFRTLCGVLMLVYYGLTPYSSHAQGCSDAGFCSMGAMRPDQHYSKKVNFKLRSLQFNQYMGRTKFNSLIHVSTLEGNFSLTNKLSVQVKIPYFKTNGRGWGLQGLGDISLSLTQNLINDQNYQVNFTLGTKLPTSNANQIPSFDLPLPMYYQPSLGTLDLVGGFSFISANWLFAAGFQQVLIHNNQNSFTHEAWIDHPRADEARLFPQSPNLKRAADVMLRVERNFRLSRLSFNVGLLPIYRFKKDRISFEDSGEEIEVEGSQGLALSLLLGATYRFNTKSSIKALFGDQLKDREVNPDGLSRQQVYSLTYLYNFQ